MPFPKLSDQFRCERLTLPCGPVRIFVVLCGLSLSVCPSLTQAGVLEDKTEELLKKGERPENMGCAWGDYNRDGWVDMTVAGHLWRNEGGKKFTHVSSNIGVGLWGDWDNDGFLDLYAQPGSVSRYDPDKDAFERITLYDGEMDGSRAMCWADLDGDGDLDVYAAGIEGGPARDMVLTNDAGRQFLKTFEHAGLYGRGVTACDFDQDNDMDVYVTNYRLKPNHLWLNDGNGKLTDAAAEYGATGGRGHGIGSCWGDIDNDGYFDIYAGNFAHRGQPHSRFLRNLGPEKGFKFEDLGECGVGYQESFASPSLADYDNDGDLDVYFTTTYRTASYGRRNYPVLYRNDGDWKFTNVSPPAGIDGLGPTYQAAWADIDNDGDLDLMTAARIFVNQGNDYHWLKMRLEGDGKTVNRAAIGAQVRVRLGDKVLTRQVEAGTSGHGNQNDPTLHFGLGAHDVEVSYTITWPDGTRQTGITGVDRQVTVQLKR